MVNTNANANSKAEDRDMSGNGTRNGANVSRRALLVAGGGIAIGTLAYVGSRARGPQASLLAQGKGAAGGHGSAGTGRLTAHPAGGAGGTGGAVPSAAPSHAPRAAVKATASPGAPGSPAASPHTPLPQATEVVAYLDDGPRVIALTIDDGPSPVYTPQVLDILQRYQVRAAFSMVGENVSYYPGVASEVAAAGHLIVNHTWDHANLTGLSGGRTRLEIDRAAAEIHAATGTAPRLFRAPYGAWTPAALRYCAAAGLTPLAWSVDPLDWSRPGVRAIVRTIMASTRSGSIILEHDGGGDRSQTVAALKIVIPRLLDEGYTFAVP
jgi:peptidoglycan/xylan/chitin deacetylase (PgdA/CDA1 family)